MATTEPKTVCVTGASGFIAAFIVEELLARGHTVHGTVRSLSKAAHLRGFAGASERLKLFEADVTDASSLAAPIAGADVVMHTATPIVIPMEGEEPQTRAEADIQQIGPALDGVVAVIEECRQAGVKQIVLTSSNAAVSYQEHPPAVVDETCWSDTTWLADRQQWYTLAKTLQEKKAWDLCGEYGIKLCTINPPLVWGSVHTSHLNFVRDARTSLAVCVALCTVAL
jgi:cinnamoyl-CoA reductase